jgi:hypothetical protein
MINEDFMKEMAKAPKQVKQDVQTDNGALQRMIDRSRKMPFKTEDLNDDAEMIKRVRHTMRPDEKLMEWYARTGLSKSQTALMSEAEILGWVLRAEEQGKDDPGAPRAAWAPKLEVPKFIQV